MSLLWTYSYRKQDLGAGFDITDAIIACARGWLGTPYHHQGSVRGAGCDCLGLIRGVWRALYGPEPEVLPPYSRDWGNATGSETLLSAACRHLIPVGCVADARSGDVLVFRMRDHGVAKHAGIVSAAPFARPALKNDLHTTCHGRARPAIHVSRMWHSRSWMPGTSPGMTGAGGT